MTWLNLLPGLRWIDNVLYDPGWAMSPEVLTVFIGYDPVESVAWHVMAHSIFKRSSHPLAIVPLNMKNLKGMYSRQRDEKQSNEFSYTRFLVPHLTSYRGIAAYFDCDMMLRGDISDLFALARQDRSKAVHVVQHDYKPRDNIKYLNNVQYSYPRKNWSSVIVWNCEHPSNRVVTPGFVNSASAAQLHRFGWLEDAEIGALDVEWNWLVGEYIDPPKSVKNVHWTNGGPYFTEYKDSDFSEEWRLEFEHMTHCLQRHDLL
jgi:hypothetical protein